MERGEFEASWKSGGKAVSLRYRIQQGTDSIAVCDVKGAPDVEAKVVNWRLYPGGEKECGGRELDNQFGGATENGKPITFTINADRLVSGGWCHVNRNETVAKMMDDNKAYRKDLYLEIPESALALESFPAFMAEAKKEKIRVGLGNYRGGKTAEELKPFAYVSFNASDVYGRGKGSFLISLSSVRQLGINVLVKDYHDDEERHYLGSLAFHFGTKAGEKPFVEDEVNKRLGLVK